MPGALFGPTLAEVAKNLSDQERSLKNEQRRLRKQGRSLSQRKQARLRSIRNRIGSTFGNRTRFNRQLALAPRVSSRNARTRNPAFRESGRIAREADRAREAAKKAAATKKAKKAAAKRKAAKTRAPAKKSANRRTR
jgi:hypothetical protein